MINYSFAATSAKPANLDDQVIIQDNSPGAESIVPAANSMAKDQVKIEFNTNYLNLSQQKALLDARQNAASTQAFHITLWRYIMRYNQLSTQLNADNKLLSGTKTSQLNAKNSQIIFPLEKIDKAYLVIDYQAKALELNDIILMLPVSDGKPTPKQLKDYQNIFANSIMALSRGINKNTARNIAKELWNGNILQTFMKNYRWLGVQCNYNKLLQNQICIFYKKN